MQKPLAAGFSGGEGRNIVSQAGRRDVGWLILKDRPTACEALPRQIGIGLRLLRKRWPTASAASTLAQARMVAGSGAGT